MILWGKTIILKITGRGGCLWIFMWFLLFGKERSDFLGLQRGTLDFFPLRVYE